MHLWSPFPYVLLLSRAPQCEESTADTKPTQNSEQERTVLGLCLLMSQVSYLTGLETRRPPYILSVLTEKREILQEEAMARQEELRLRYFGCFTELGPLGLNRSLINACDGWRIKDF